MKRDTKTPLFRTPSPALLTTLIPILVVFLVLGTFAYSIGEGLEEHLIQNLGFRNADIWSREFWARNLFDVLRSVAAN